MQSVQTLAGKSTQRGEENEGFAAQSEQRELDEQLATLRSEDLLLLLGPSLSPGGPGFRDYNPFRNTPFNNTFNNAFPNTFGNTFRNK
jgi:hypothetical protein